jgi:hypothetical protein
LLTAEKVQRKNPPAGTAGFDCADKTQGTTLLGPRFCWYEAVTRRSLRRLSRIAKGL